MQTLEILNLIFSHVMPVPSVVTIFLITQTICSSITGVTFFYKTVRNKSEILTLLACLVPCVFIITYTIVAPLIFGSFVNGGISENVVVLILGLTMTREFFVELIVLLVLFVALVFCYKRFYTLSKIQFANFYLLEFVIGFALLALYSTWHISKDPNIFTDFLVTPFTYLIYGYFAIIYKVLLLVVGLMIALIFSDKGEKTTESVNVYNVVDLQEACLKYLSHRKIFTSIAFFITFLLLFLCIVAAALYDYGYSYDNFIRACKEMWFLMPMFVYLFAVGIVGLFFAFFPRLTPAYRKLEQNDLFKQFYKEVVKENLDQKMQIDTRSFTLKTVFLIPFLKIKDETIMKTLGLTKKGENIVETPSVTKKIKKTKEKVSIIAYLPLILMLIGIGLLDGLWQYYLVFVGVLLGAIFSLIAIGKTNERIGKVGYVVIFLCCTVYSYSHILDIPYINEPLVVNITNVQVSTSMSSKGVRSYSVKGITEESESISFRISKDTYEYIQKYPALTNEMKIEYLPNTKTLLDFSFSYDEILENESLQEFYELYQKYGDKD